LIRYNRTGVDQSIVFCVVPHWDEHGDHPDGTYEDCKGHTLVIPAGGNFWYDETAPNGNFLTAILDSRGFE
jgi:hypothetical protein